MSALDIIMQRQVPARPPVRQNDAGASDDRGPSGADPFSQVLSGQHRRPEEKSTRTDAASGEEPSKETEATDTAADEETGEVSDKGNSDEMLALLDGVVSGSANAENAQAEEENADGNADADAGETPDEQLEPELAENQVDAEASAKAAGGEQAATGAAAQANAHMAAASPTTPVAASVANGTAASNRSAGNEAPQDRGEKKSSDAKQSARGEGIGTEVGPARRDSEKPLILEGRNRAASEGRQQEDRLDSKAQNVEVLESRRFMATQAMGANAQMLTRSLADAGENAQRAQSAASAQSAAIPGQPQSGQMLHTLKLQLNPISLGSVTAVLKLSGEELTVDIKVQTAEAYRQLSDDNQAILKALRGQGFGVEQINIQHVAGPERGSNQTQQQAGVQSGFQDPGSGDAQASGKESGGQGGRSQFGSQGDGQGHDQKPYSTPDAGRSDGVYL